jgi:aminoglycoside phosphotransferase (APT) family kinase protein
MTVTAAGPEAAELAGALTLALRARRADQPDLVPVGAPIETARSTLYRFGPQSTQAEYIVKRPVVASSFVDADPVLPPAEQFEALELAYRWQQREDRHAVVRPVAMLAAHGAFAMEYVAGPTLTGVLHRSVLELGAAVTTAAAAGDFLRRFHRHSAVGEIEVDLAEEVRGIRRLGAASRSSGVALPPEAERALDTVGGAERARSVVLHGDFVPSNLIVRDDRELVMIDPLLARTGPAVDDLARFLAVLSSDSVFLPGTAVAAVRRRRRAIEDAFRAAYGTDDAAVLLELRLLKQHVLRWLRRRDHSRLRRAPGLREVRQGLIDRHMRTLLQESAERLAARGGSR